MATGKECSLRAIDSATPASGFLVLTTSEFPHYLDQFVVVVVWFGWFVCLVWLVGLFDTYNRKSPH